MIDDIRTWSSASIETNIAIAADGTVTLDGDLDVNGRDYTGTLNGTVRVQLWETLDGASVETNLQIRVPSLPAVLPPGDWRFFRLGIE